jgi:hypothetical protein
MMLSRVHCVDFSFAVVLHFCTECIGSRSTVLKAIPGNFSGREFQNHKMPLLTIPFAKVCSPQGSDMQDFRRFAGSTVEPGILHAYDGNLRQRAPALLEFSKN